MREKQACTLYFRELFGTLAAYCLVLVGSIYLAASMPTSILRTLIITSPIVPALLMVWAIARQFQRMDEYVRKWQLENVTLAAAVTAAFALSYGFMESAGFPHLSMFITWSVLMGSWGAITCLRGWKERLQ